MPEDVVLNDFELASLLRRGEQIAFREIYERYWDFVYGRAYRRMQDSFEAEEIVQEIFCNLWRKRERIVLSKGFEHYFSGAVKYEVINRFAKQARHDVLKIKASSLHSIADNSTHQNLDLKELQVHLQKSISELPEKCSQVFRLKYEQEYTQQEIARELGISEKTVEAHLAKARKLLKIKFGQVLTLLICFL